MTNTFKNYVLGKTIRYTLLLVVIIISVLVGICIHHESKSVNFGSTQDPVPFKRLKDKRCKAINREGLDRLNAFGSGFINYRDLKPLLIQNSNKLHMVNLLHDQLYYYNDRCLRWYGLGYTDKTFGNVMFTHKPFKFAYKSIIRFIFGTPPVNDPSRFKTEEQIIRELGGNYSIPLKNNPDWLTHQEFVEDLIKFFETLPEGATVYFHCSHGRGRTTTFLVLYDIFKNGKKVSLQDIANRHYCLGREDVLDTELLATGTWTQEGLIARKKFVEHFYAYMNDPKGYHHQSWIQWNQSKGIIWPQVTIHRRRISL